MFPNLLRLLLTLQKVGCTYFQKCRRPRKRRVIMENRKTSTWASYLLLKHDFAIVSEWFYENYVVHNPDKCHFLTLGFNEPFPDFSFKNTIIKNATEEKILEIVIDNNLNFKSHMKKICEKANQKLSALARISKLTTSTQRKKLINSFINSQFTYCPLIWMFSSKGCYKRINKIHERSLRFILSNYESSFDISLSTLNEKMIH